MLNNIIIMGRLAADPELKSTSSGIAVCAFSVAVERDYAAQDGKRPVDFIAVVAWRQTAEFVYRYFSKGSMIVVQGSLQSRKYTDKYNNSRTAWEVQASSAWFGDSKKKESNESADSEPRDVASAAYSSGDDSDFVPLPKGDLPF